MIRSMVNELTFTSMFPFLCFPLLFIHKPSMDNRQGLIKSTPHCYSSSEIAYFQQPSVYSPRCSCKENKHYTTEEHYTSFSWVLLLYPFLAWWRSTWANESSFGEGDPTNVKMSFLSQTHAYSHTRVLHQLYLPPRFTFEELELSTEQRKNNCNQYKSNT